MTHLTVHEWGRTPVHNAAGPAPRGAFTRSEANALLRAARSHALANEPGTNILIDRYSEIRAQQVVGVIAAPGCSLEILPKIDSGVAEGDEAIRTRLISMLDVALGLKLGDGQALAMARQKETLLDILIRLFTDRLLAEARRGLPRGYIAQEDDLAALRGRLDVIRQFTHHAVRPDRLACRFDTLNPDTPLLRIMKACVVLLRHHARAVETQRRLDELRFVLADVSDAVVSALPWTQVRIDRTNRRWESLYGLAKLFLKREWQRTNHDAKAGQGITLLFAMNDLFEAYIAALARKALRRSRPDPGKGVLPIRRCASWPAWQEIPTTSPCRGSRRRSPGGSWRDLGRASDRCRARRCCSVDGGGRQRPSLRFFRSVCPAACASPRRRHLSRCYDLEGARRARSSAYSCRGPISRSRSNRRRHRPSRSSGFAGMRVVSWRRI